MFGNSPIGTNGDSFAFLINLDECSSSYTDTFSSELMLILGLKKNGEEGC